MLLLLAVHRGIGLRQRIVRGLLAVWRATGEEEFRTRAQEASLSLAFDFLSEEGFYPVITLPDTSVSRYWRPLWK